MRLLIISHTQHYSRNGSIVGWGPTVREIDHLSTLFDTVVHLAPLHTEPAPESAAAYQSNNIEVHTVRPSGGHTLLGKVSILIRWPQYAFSMFKEIRCADVIHVRCPANISLLALLMLLMFGRRKRRWIKYAGNWKPAKDEPLSYRLQRRLARTSFLRAEVTVNGRLEGDPPHVHSFLNPCLTESEIEAARIAAEEKDLTLPIRLLYVGWMDDSKGAGRAIRILAALRNLGIQASLKMAGDGENIGAYRNLAKALNVEEFVNFLGWIPRAEVPHEYAESHFTLLPSESEGWPKVLSEAMAYGSVPIAGDVSSIAQILCQCGTGCAIDPFDVGGFAAAIRNYVDRPDSWRSQRTNGIASAPDFGYSKYLLAVRTLLGLTEKRAPSKLQRSHQTE